MRSASPGFQPDRAGSPGFHLASDAGFQTQTPAAIGALELLLTYDPTTSSYSPQHTAWLHASLRNSVMAPS